MLTRSRPIRAAAVNDRERAVGGSGIAAQRHFS
jgi:hypothetical protein